MSAYAVPAKDRAAQVRRMRQFLLSNAPVAFGAGAVLFLLYGIFRLPLVAVLGVIATGMGVMYLLALRAVQRGNIEAAVVARVAITLGFLGDVARAEGDRAAARALLAESLALWRQLGDECGVAQCLEASPCWPIRSASRAGAP
jgi:hypothetical protein